ncbi:hypothetical protein P8C59_009513 [Phyllachora maydis]|uniref:Altered inheritance of mitochondria protein 11 n=1 Tax=Phyllachora maydis TaxID=1825666 RepID=A0AAD9IDY1_9PEZI|nr:hypothetical protein P8C59_009513 [Phyllachora maydis]
MLSRRSLQQLGLFFGGAAFLGLSVAVSRRAVLRHIKSSQLKFYQPSHSTQSSTQKGVKDPKDKLVALEALNLATLNVMAFAFMVTGGVAFAFDISSIDDLRRMTRQSIRRAGGEAAVDAAAEKDVADWVNRVLKINVPTDQDAKEQNDKS